MRSSLFFSLPIEYPKLFFKDSRLLFGPLGGVWAFVIFSSELCVSLVSSELCASSMVVETFGASSLCSDEKLSSGFFPNDISLVAMVSVLLYPGIFSFRISMSDGIKIILGKIARFRTTFVTLTAVRMFEIRTVSSSSTTVSFASFVKSS